MSKSPVLRPRRRVDGLIVRPLGSEVIVYDERTDRASCLNETSARVWELCDGERTPAQIARTLGASEDLVAFALDLLGKEKLLDERLPPAPAFVGLTRREAIRALRAASVAVALPIVASILAPTPAEAGASCVPHNSQCSSSSGKPCCLPYFCNGTKCV